MKKKLSIYLHISLWAVYSMLLFAVLNKNFTTQDAIIKCAVMIIIQVAVFYANANYFFPRLLQRKRPWWYVLNIIVMLIVILFFLQWFEAQFMPEEMQERMQERMNRMRERPFRPPPKQLIRAGMVLQLMSLLFILLFSSAYSAAQLGRRKELQDTQSREEKLSSEMKFLKSQINPHFLFNSLNNIYSLTLSGSEKSSEMILKLSSMLRYILYECNVPYVELEKEWEYILNFIEFQKLKSQHQLNIELDYFNEDHSSEIAPMILIPFVENAFKHSNIEDVKNGWMKISLNNRSEGIIFQIDNSIGEKEKNKDEQGGIGLENVKRRLELIYGEKAKMITNAKQNSYSIVLSIDKKEAL